MSEQEFKPCPFCGNEPAPYWNGVGCATWDCVLNGLHLDADKWNRRAQPAEVEGVEVVAWLHRQGNYTEAADRPLTDDEEDRGWEQDELMTVADRINALSAVTAERDELRGALESFPGFLCGTATADAWIERKRTTMQKS